jgi:branched-chain amino acid transport system ATP-binding protein
VSSRVDEHLEKLRLQHRRNDMAGDLAYSEQRALEIGMALATDPEILLLDEPTSGMSRDESAYMVELIREVTEGKTLLVVEHDMSVVFDLCDNTSVLVYGQILASGAPETVRADRRVQEAYLGEEAA